MKKDAVVAELPPFTEAEEAELTQKLQGLAEPALSQYIESAQRALRNKALAPSWRPRVELGLRVAEATLLKEAAAPAAAAALP